MVVAEQVQQDDLHENAMTILFAESWEEEVHSGQVQIGPPLSLSHFEASEFEFPGWISPPSAHSSQCSPVDIQDDKVVE